MHDAVPAIAAVGVSPIVRLPDKQGWMVKRTETLLGAPTSNRVTNTLQALLILELTE